MLVHVEFQKLHRTEGLTTQGTTVLRFCRVVGSGGTKNEKVSVSYFVLSAVIVVTFLVAALLQMHCGSFRFVRFGLVLQIWVSDTRKKSHSFVRLVRSFVALHVGLQLETDAADGADKRFLIPMNSQMCFQIPGAAE